MFRREFLGVGTVLLTAGCGGFGVGRREPAAFETALSGPEAVDLGETFTVTVSVTNRGGSAGTYEGTLRAFPEMIYEAKRLVSVGPIAPDATREVEVGPLVAPYAGRWSVELDAERTLLDVFPRLVDAGQAVEVAGGLRLTVRSIVRRDSFDYAYYDEARQARTPEPGETFVFADLSVANIGVDSHASPGRAEFSAVGDQARYPIYLGKESWEQLLVPGDPYPGKRELSPQSSLSGWVPFEMPDPGDGFVGVAWNRDRENSPPEAIWRALPTRAQHTSTLSPSLDGAFLSR